MTPRSTRRAGARRRARSEARRDGGRLVVCPTPIGNLEDITLRVLSALREADVVACEDTRRTGVLLERYGVQATLVPYHEHNERERAADLVERMRAGAVVALVSDAGHAARLRPGLRARPGLRGGGARGGGAARAVRGAGRAGRVGAARRRVALRRLPAPQARGRWRRVRLAGDAGGVRVAQAGRRLAGRAGRARPGPPGGGVPGADEAARGGRAGDAATLAARFAEAEPRGEVVLVVGRRAAADGRSTRRRSPRCGGWSRRGPSRGWRRGWWRSSRARRRTRCTRRPRRGEGAAGVVTAPERRPPRRGGSSRGLAAAVFAGRAAAPVFAPSRAGSSRRLAAPGLRAASAPGRSTALARECSLSRAFLALRRSSAEACRVGRPMAE